MTAGIRIASAVALSLALASAPVAARDWHGGGGYGHGYRHHGGGGIGVGGVLLGAAIIGTVAAVASSNNHDRGYGYDGRYAQSYSGGYADAPAYGYDQGYGSEYGQYDGYDRQGGGYYDQARVDPVETCSRAAERQAQGRGGYAQVTGIDRVVPYDGGSVVRGSVQLDRGGGSQRFGFSCTANYDGQARVRFG